MSMHLLTYKTILEKTKLNTNKGRFQYTRKNAQVVTSLQTSCNKSVHKLSTSCVRTACS